MNLANFFTVRFFAITTVLMVGIVVNGIMMAREYVAIPELVEEGPVISRLVSQKFTKVARDTDVKAYGLPDALRREVLRSIARKERRYRSRPNPIVEMGMKDEDGLVRQVVKNAFCKKPTGTQPPYKAASLLIVEPTGGSQGTALTLRQARSGLRMRYAYVNDNIKKIYKNMELVKYSRRTDMTCVSIALIFLGQANSMFDGAGSMISDDGTEGVPPTCKGLISKNKGLQNRLLEYFSNFHYLAELAHDPKNRVCKLN